MNAGSGRRFRFRHPVEVRFVDLDAASHVHHSRALVYFEEARWAYWAKVVAPPKDGDWGFVLARAALRWSRRVLWPETLSVGVRVASVGRRSFEMEYEAADGSGDVMVSGSTTQVTYDFAAGRSIRVSDELRAALESFDGPFADLRGG